MKKHNYKKSALIMLVVVVFALCTALTVNAASKGDFFRKAGQLFSESLSIKETADKGDFAIKGKDFVVCKDEFNNLVEQNMLSSKAKSEAVKLTLGQFIIKRSLYYAALEVGCSTDETKINSEIEANKEAIRAASNYSDFLAYLDGAGMTEDEYWASQFDSIELHGVIGQYVDAMRAKFEKDNSLTTANAWVQYYYELTKAAVAAQRLELDKSLTWELSPDDELLKGLWN